MFGSIGGPELILILIIALVVFGPRKLPEMGRSLGKMMMEFRRASSDFQRTIEQEVEAEKAPPRIAAAPDTVAQKPALEPEEPARS
jgi:TatA/E family protein of Tat protein translocase